MTLVGQILEHLVEFQRTPDELLAALPEAEARLVRELEHTSQGNRQWRATSLKILDVSQMLNQGEDPQAIFHRIVQEARAIIGADVGYISLNDPPSGLTRVLATSGVITEEFRSIRMPMGTGILGLVAAEKRPVWTFDHPHDPKVSHIEAIDDAVQAEGIRAILGAPLHIDGATIGALMVADRQPRRFTHDEVLALELLGSITSVALHNAQRLEEQAALKATQSDQIASLYKLADIDDRLLSLLTDRADLDALSQVLAESLACPVHVWTPDTTLSPALNELRLKAEATGELVITDTGSALSARLGARPVGGIALETAAGPLEKEALRRAVSVFTALALFQESLLAATSRKVDDLIYAVALGTAGTDELRRLRQLTKVDLAGSDDVYFVAIHDGDDVLTRARVENLVTGRRAITRHDQHFCLLIQPETSVHKMMLPLLALAQDHDIVVSAVRIGSTSHDADAHAIALDYLRAGVTLDIRGSLVSDETLGAVGLILGANPQALQALRETTIAALVDYDEAHQTELEDTARAYFDHGQSVPATAKALYVHVNTARQRLDRITALLGEGWSTGTRGLDVQLALKIRQLSDPGM